MSNVKNIYSSAFTPPYVKEIESEAPVARKLSKILFHH